MSLFIWLRGEDEDTSDARKDTAKSDNDWQENLKDKDYTEYERSIKMNNNYKDTFGKTAKEIRNIGEEELGKITDNKGKEDKSARVYLNNEALKVTKELLDDQTNKTKNLVDKEDIDRKLNKESEKRKDRFR